MTQARKIIGYRKETTTKKHWVTAKILQKTEKRREVEHRSTESAKNEYRRLNNELRKEIEKAIECWWTEQCNEQVLQNKELTGRCTIK